MSTSAAANRSPRLILRFAMYSAIALLLAGGGILWFARHAAESRSEREVLEHAETTSALIADRLQASDFAAPVSNSRRTELDDLFAPLLGGEVVRVKLWSENGTITYSNDASLIGAHHPEASVAGAFAGMAESEIGGLNDDGGGAGENIKVLSAYVPVRLGGSQQPTGALELYTSFDEVTADAMATVKPVAVALALALLLLYASLFPILRQVTGALEARTRKLQQQSDELEKTIGERRQALASLREADARYRALVEELPLVSYVSALDTPGFSSYVSPQLEDMLGYTPEEWLETPGLFWDVIHEDDAERVRNEHRIGYANAETFSTQYRMRAKGGRVIWVEDQIRVIHDREGKRALAQGFLIDITARKNTEIALTENEARFRGLVGNIPGVVFRCDIYSDWTMEFLSDPIEELVGYPSSDFIDNRARTFASVIHPDDRAGLEAEVASSVADRKAYTTDYRVIHRDGSVRYVIERGQAILAADGRIRLDGAIFDVTDRRLAENERLKLAGIVESSDDAITSADLDGIVTSWNKGAERMFGYTAEEMIGQSGEILVPEGEKLDPTARIAMVVEMGEGRFEATRRRKDGTLIDIAVTMSAVCNAAGEVIAVAAIAQDITDRKRVEQERAQFTRELEVQNERLLELDRLKDEFVALVSHELRTPLTSIRGYLELVLDGEAGKVTDEQRQFLGVVERNANRLLDLVGDLLFLAQIEAGKLTLEVGAVDLAAVAAESVETSRPLAEEKDITLTLATSPLPLLAGDRARLAQLLDNLVSNAIKFTPEGGRVDVRASSARGNAVLEVRDTGMGISADEQEQVFERFFRTSRATEQAIQGTGLGLAISKAIVHAHGGQITLASNEGEGATFRVVIPIRAAKPRTAEQEEIAS
ncbi:MAG TPA: PAS domain S-box protein [Gaiellaceae bacterium]|nr:PAS domain S-box protein [Gaiellaceae bacterium]